MTTLIFGFFGLLAGFFFLLYIAGSRGHNQLSKQEKFLHKSDLEDFK